MRKLLYYFECIFLGVAFLSTTQFAAAQSASQKDDAKKQQITIPADPRTLGEVKYQELKAKGLLPQPAQVPFSKARAKTNRFTVQGIKPHPPTPQLTIPLDGTFTASMAPNDDGSSSLIALPFTFRFYGTPYTSLYINNNGDVTFGDSYGAYTSSGFPSADVPPMIAPFWADVDTRPTGGGLVYHKIEAHRITIIWDHVGYYSGQVDKLNTFELILSDGTDATVGIGKNMCFSYDDMQWTTGSASSGVGGFGGTPATVGVNQGDGVQYAQIGRFDHAGTDYDGETGANDGVSYLDNFNFCTDISAGVTTITGTVFHDLDGSGAQDPGEPGLADWTVNLSGAATASRTTDANGNYIFSFLSPGTYTVSEVLQTGWVQTSPPPPRTYTVRLTSGELSAGNDFGNAHTGSISGQKFYDFNGDGVKDAGEPGLAGWTIDLAGPVNSSAVTDDAGDYMFQNLTPGIYTLTETLRPGWAQTLPAAGSYVVLLESGDDLDGVDFGNRQTVGRGNILGSVFDDRNGNGVKDPDELGLSAWRVQLSGPGGIATLTDANGNYTFSNIAAGNYAVTVFLPSGWAQTLPPGGAPRNVTVVTGGTVRGVDFGTRMVTGVEESLSNPTEYELYQNFPNPFNPTTSVSFYLPSGGYVTLRVYNVLGIEVASLFEGRMSSGTHSVVWDAQDVPSGIYVYRLTAGSFTAVKKMVLMK
jgi:hypothetical protein